MDTVTGVEHADASALLEATAYWTAAVRARESARPDPLLLDPWSPALAGDVGMAWIAPRPDSSSQTPSGVPAAAGVAAAVSRSAEAIATATAPGCCCEGLWFDIASAPMRSILASGFLAFWFEQCCSRGNRRRWGP